MPKFFLFVALASCGGGAAESELCTTSDTPTFLLGTDHGETAPFSPLQEDQALQLIRGPQGGCHLPLAFRTQGLDAETARVRYAVTLIESGEVLIDMVATLDLDPLPAGPTTCAISDFRAFMPRAWMAEEKRVRVDTTITDLRGVRASETVTVRVKWPDDRPEIEHELLCGARSP